MAIFKGVNRTETRGRNNYLGLKWIGWHGMVWVLYYDNLWYDIYREVIFYRIQGGELNLVAS